MYHPEEEDAQAADEPWLGCFLSIRPPPAEAAFWESDECRSWSRQVYFWSFCAFVIFFPFLLRPLILSPQTRMVVTIEIGTVVDICGLIMWHRVSAKWSPHARLRFRTAFFRFHRVIDLIVAVAMVLHIRTLLSSKGIQAVKEQVQYEHGESLVVSLHNAFVVGGAQVVLHHGVHSPLPFIPQLVLAVGYTLLLFALHLHAAVHILGTAGHAHHMYTMCQNVNEVQSLVEAVLLSTPMPMDFREQVCAQHHTVVIVMFMVLLAVALPVYVSYRLEWYTKMKFVLRLRGYEPPVRVNWPVGTDILLVAGYVTFAWNLVVCYHDTFMRLSKPL